MFRGSEVFISFNQAALSSLADDSDRENEVTLVVNLVILWVTDGFG